MSICVLVHNFKTIRNRIKISFLSGSTHRNIFGFIHPWKKTAPFRIFWKACFFRLSSSIQMLNKLRIWKRFQVSYSWLADFSGCERAGLVWRHRWSWVMWRARSGRFGLCGVESASDGQLWSEDSHISPVERPPAVHQNHFISVYMTLPFSLPPSEGSSVVWRVASGSP